MSSCRPEEPDFNLTRLPAPRVLRSFECEVWSSPNSPQASDGQTGPRTHIEGEYRHGLQSLTTQAVAQP